MPMTRLSIGLTFSLAATGSVAPSLTAFVTEPNRYGPAVVWPYMDSNGTIYIRCFLPGAGA